MLVRDRQGLEVLIVRRHGGLQFGPGAWVFPGGKLDAQDLDPAWQAESNGWAELDGEDRCLRLCAIRETFEEAGILLGRAGLGRLGDAASAAALRTEVITGDLSFRQAIKALGLGLDLNLLTPFSRWITPEHQTIRFDAAFYIARAPEGQSAICDGRETTAAEWLTPSDALALADAEHRVLMRPTRANLELLGASACVATALQAAKEGAIATVR
jgi:8-oxo-dGTP pyrophosphatase MutT (NUDIX family)